MSGFIPPFYTEGGGSLPSANILPLPLTSDPSSYTKGSYPGQIAYSQKSGNLFFFSGSTPGPGGTLQYNWTLLQSGGSSLSTLTGNTGGTITPSAGNINIVGSGPVSVAGAGSTLTISDSSVATLTGNTGGAISAVSNNINVIGSGSVSVSGTGSTLTISSASTPILTWNLSPAGVAMLTANGYVSTAGTAQTFTMPSAAAFGDQLGIMVNGAGAVTIQRAGVGQTIRINNAVQGATGKFTSSNQGAALLFVCVVASSSGTTGTWEALSAVGTWNPS